MKLLCKHGLEWVKTRQETCLAQNAETRLVMKESEMQRRKLTAFISGKKLSSMDDDDFGSFSNFGNSGNSGNSGYSGVSARTSKRESRDSRDSRD